MSEAMCSNNDAQVIQLRSVWSFDQSWVKFAFLYLNVENSYFD